MEKYEVVFKVTSYERKVIEGETFEKVVKNAEQAARIASDTLSNERGSYVHFEVQEVLDYEG